MSQIFELVVFTAAAKDYADFILDVIEKRAEALYGQGPVISYRLYR